MVAPITRGKVSFPPSSRLGMPQPLDEKSLLLQPPPLGAKRLRPKALPKSRNYPGPPGSETWMYSPEFNPSRDYETGIQGVSAVPYKPTSTSPSMLGGVPETIFGTWPQSHAKRMLWADRMLGGGNAARSAAEGMDIQGSVRGTGPGVNYLDAALPQQGAAVNYLDSALPARRPGLDEFVRMLSGAFGAPSARGERR